MKISIEQFIKKIAQDASLKKGCIVDTNVLFAANYVMDPFHEWAWSLFEAFSKNGVAAYTNLNVRSEFIELNRRVHMAESLVDFYGDFGNDLEFAFAKKLKSIESSVREAPKEKRVFKLSDQDIKLCKKLMNANAESNGTPNWKNFCINYFSPHIKVVWERTVSELGIQFLGTREIESKEYFDEHPKWEEMLSVLGESGIGTSDAMIVNLFLKSKLPMIASADMDVSDAVTERAQPNKIVLAPI